MATTRSRRSGGRHVGAANRAALLASARELFDSEGLDVPLSAIARRAGVGQGSLYRHFPDRRSLALAVFEDNVREIEQLGSSPEASVADLLRLLTEQSVTSAAFVQSVLAGPRNEELAAISDRVTEVIMAKAETGMLPFASPEDVMLGVGMVASVIATAVPEERREVAHRAWTLLGVSV